jgi:hypothetical protein
MKATKRQKNRGQALAEFLVISGVIAALLLLFAVLAKYQDVSHATQMASRYVAFDAAVNGGRGAKTYAAAADVDVEVRRRFFAETAAPIKTGDAAGDFKANSHSFWTLPDGAALLPRKQDVAVQASMSAGPALSMYLLRGLKGLSGQGMVTASVTTPLARMPDHIGALEMLSGMDIRMNRRMVMLVDGWDASGYGRTNDVVRSVTQVPTSLLKGLDVFVEPAILISEMGGKGPAIGDLERWQTLVPADRRGGR